LLLITDKDGKTAWHYATKRYNSEFLQKVWKWAKGYLTTEEINNKLLLGTDKDKTTTLPVRSNVGKFRDFTKTTGVI